MMQSDRIPAARTEARILANHPVSSGLLRLDLQCRAEQDFRPGQFAMVNLAGSGTLVFARPFSILAVAGDEISFLYRIVGRGTAALAECRVGDRLTVLGPLGTPFPVPESGVPAVLISGGVGLPPLWSWWRRYGRPQKDRAFFGARDGADAPWNLLPAAWRVSVDRLRDVPEGRQAWEGLVTDLARDELAPVAAGPGLVLACGPVPLLKAAAVLAAEHGWDCRLSLEEHMGCGYGVCKGCVVPVRDDDPRGTGRRNATCCQDGPVFRAEDLLWD